MNENYFSTQIQSILSQLVMKLLDRVSQPEETPKPKWIREGERAGSGESSGGTASRFEELITEASQRYGVDAQLVRSVIKAESNFNPQAVSRAGAQGLMQLMPGTAAGLGVENAFDPQENIDGGVRLLRRLLNRYDGNLALTLAAYNAGPGAVDRYGGIPPYRETQTYVNRVMKTLNSGKQWSA